MSDSIETKHADMVAKLAKTGEDILKTASAHDIAIWHAATGVAGEAGELLDAVKKAVVYNKPLDIDNVIEELGDLEYYMEELRRQLQISRKLTLTRNMNKLERRYPGFNYTDQRAQERADKQE